MNPKTKFDLSLIKTRKEKIYALNKDIRHIEEACEHFDFKLSCEEVIGFDMAPVKKCLVCSHYNHNLSYDEKYKAISDQLCWGEDEGSAKFSHDEIDNMVKAGGFNHKP